MDDKTFRIIIVGGGIAGLAAAIALRKEGRSILVLEKSRMLGEIGALISLQPNASKIASSFGLDPFLQASKPVIDQEFRILDIDGNIVQSIPSNASIYGAERVVYHRQDLHLALRDAAIAKDRPGEPVKIQTSAAVASCDPQAGTVTLQSGETLEADLIVGADGIRSAIRNSVLGRPVSSVPTGLSAYRILIDSSTIPAELPVPKDIFDIRRPATTMIMGHDRRVVCGPGRGFEKLGIVALLPDDKLNEISHSESWTTCGSLEKLLESFSDFPPWILQIFQSAPDIALWQLRDLDPLEKWVEGRVILIGDAAHAMLPTQGQGASQSFEDAEALGAFFADITGRPSLETVHSLLTQIFNARYERATLIQGYSRQQARPATNKGSKQITLKSEEFMDYNCKYSGVKDWIARTVDKETISV
ncbi:hypothetical protein BDV39DRAFT_216772 [Aspergillus sergii]|uniref:FAD-binding domain-containing protein n=1 Tax=Aspergillus sergii TaxID=1034303 RepID=A0A5N6WYE0_9EURO|nr:hypothetical protein BDV39DRAFT_216772 [Aspergillus sergii]